MLTRFKKQTGQHNLCMAGGVALNCSANGVIKRSGMFRRMFVQPAAGDDGSALGAGLYVQRVHEPQLPRKPMSVPLWGPSYDNDAIGRVIDQRADCESAFFASVDELVSHIATRLSRGEVIGWFQGRMEFGPRALGSRSILGDPRDPKMRDRINSLVKKREAFRPFAPAVTVEAAAEYFEIEGGDEPLYASMLFVTYVREPYRNQFPSITHVDGSARVQTVAQKDNPLFWRLLTEFGAINGAPILLNTSFNVAGQPIVCTPSEALDTFLAAGFDALAIGDYVVVRNVNADRQTAEASQLAER
jgi:carbamoyltransferase